ncbi:MAG: NAD/NADP octopine/nopaline dehydrogenase family protein [Synergistales bacterium]
MSRITVMSAGNGGQALAGDLALRGHEVTLYEHPLFESRVATIRERGNVIELENKIVGRGLLQEATTDAELALAEAGLVYFTAPSFAQKAFFELALPHFRDGQILVLSPGNFGTFALHRAFREAGKQVLVAETDNLPYACVAREPGRVDIKGVKKSVTLAALPNSEYARVEAAVKGAFCTAVVRGENVLHTSLSNTNSIAHCGPMLMNAGRIEDGKGTYRFYAEGMPPSVCRVMEAADRERVAVGAAFGLTLASTFETIKTQYGVEGRDLHEVIHANPAFGGIDAPSTLNHRFLTEDTPFSMVPAAALGKLAGVPTPASDALVFLLGVAMGQDFSETGPGLESMGLSGMTVEEIRRLVLGEDR